ncbi:hypothetical protein MRS60_17210 [Burkholderia pyrrocinia]|uniref:hypothetical protein n=1 Tax=Burkholderia pyrrocinia TaxID=60550 RepID=UPI001FB3316B|nr:hypothetical protein [Burkholderia pyrrocinia]UOB58536.1 hypothetical protein MRS60_17210 [Burkholderia pyrrocinia]
MIMIAVATPRRSMFILATGWITGLDGYPGARKASRADRAAPQHTSIAIGTAPSPCFPCGGVLKMRDTPLSLAAETLARMVRVEIDAGTSSACGMLPASLPAACELSFCSLPC